MALATMWSFQRLRAHLINIFKVLSLAPCRYLELAHAYNFEEGTRDAMWELACCEELPSVEEAKRIGFDFYYRVTEYRERRTKATLRIVDRILPHLNMTYKYSYRCATHELANAENDSKLKTILPTLRCSSQNKAFSFLRCFATVSMELDGLKLK